AGVSLDLGRALTLDSQALAVTAQPGQGVARLSAPWLSWSNSQAALLVDQLHRAPLAASGGTASLTLQASQRLDVTGPVVTQGMGQLTLRSD
ncbi:hypothetical protein ABTL32_19215, partial [Acinetobacter baumannii]